jgi:HAD superfamily hydrolase (TIGR01549 family)
METINLSKLKGIIFDMDGVIFDVISSVQQSVEDAIIKYKLKNENIEEGLQEVAHLIEELQNFPIPKIILNSYDLLKGISLLEGHRLIKKLRIAVYVFNQFNDYKEGAGIFEGIDGLIKSLYDKHKKLAILTNNKSTYAEEVLKKFNIDKYFDVIIGFNEAAVKPSPEGILKILDMWKLKDSEAVFIGDMVTDILAGQAANVKTISVASGLAKKDSLLGKKPDYLVNNTEELKKLFE